MYLRFTCNKFYLKYLFIKSPNDKFPDVYRYLFNQKATKNLFN